jgi:hypothetical protein
LLAASQLEFRPGDNQMQKAGFRANGTVAFRALDPLRRFDRESNRATVAAALVDHRVAAAVTVE